MMFEPFPKIPRLRRDCTITEKIDGSNGQVFIRPMINGHPSESDFEMGVDTQIMVDGAPAIIRAGSRNRWLQQGGKGDNMGFGAWVYQHAHELAALGFGRHFGEWYGAGIQRRYGLDHKRFALFNVDRWGTQTAWFTPTHARPACCGVVPVLYRGPFSDVAVDTALNDLRVFGSFIVSESFRNPEGIIVFMHASRTMHKVLLENDEIPKGNAVTPDVCTSA